jgi:hypothetical protein
MKIIIIMMMIILARIWSGQKISLLKKKKTIEKKIYVIENLSKSNVQKDGIKLQKSKIISF